MSKVVVELMCALPSRWPTPAPSVDPNRGKRPGAVTMRRCTRARSQSRVGSFARPTCSRIRSSPSCSGRPLVGVFCTSEPDGVIHAVPMWFAVTGDSIALATSSRSRKVANLRLESRATLVVHDSRPGTEICGVSIRGRVDVPLTPRASASSRRSTLATCRRRASRSPRLPSSSRPTTSRSCWRLKVPSRGTSGRARRRTRCAPPAAPCPSCRRLHAARIGRKHGVRRGSFPWPAGHREA